MFFMRHALALFLFTCVIPATAGISQPGCDALASWADTFSPPAGRAGPASVPAIFRDEAFAGMFGKALDKWEARDFRSLDNYMKSCQQQLFKQDRQKANQINKVRRQLPSVQLALEQSGERASGSTEQAASSSGQRQPNRRKTPEAPAPRPPVEPGTFTLPGCEALNGWAGRLKRGETVQVTPKVEVSSLLRPQWTAPLFGLPAERWSRNQYTSVYQELTACRNAAKKRDDSAAFSRLHQAAKVVGKGGQAMRRVDRFREEAAESVERILGHQASPALPKIVEAAQMALRGKDPTEFMGRASVHLPDNATGLSEYCPVAAGPAGRPGSTNLSRTRRRPAA